MKRFYILMTLLCLAVSTMASADAETQFQWPVKGAKPGSNITSTPQSYIGQERNLNSLFIEAPEGTVVVSPVTGVVRSVFVNYYSSLIATSGWICETSHDELIALLRAEPNPKFDMKYVSGSISIQGADGRTVTISGLSGEQIFKTGQKITRGEPIGRVAYSYKPIGRPSIMIGVSKGGRDDDPMTPFGLKSSFQPYKKIEPIASFTPAKVKEDFLTYIDAVRECYPGLYEVISEKELERYVRSTVDRIDKSSSDWLYWQIEQLMQQTLALVHDCHISSHGPQWQIQFTANKIFAADIGWINDTLVCVNAASGYKHLIGRPVRSVNGMSADSMKSRRIAEITGYDAKVESTIKAKLALDNYSLFFNDGGKAFNPDMKIEMADSAGVLDVKAVPVRSARAYYLGQYRQINHHKDGYSTRMINDKTAYLGIGSFDLSRVAVEEIGRFIDSVERARVPHLIIDVRNNGGEDINVLTKLYSYIAGEPMTLDDYLKVNRQGGYRTFARSIVSLTTAYSQHSFPKRVKTDIICARPNGTRFVPIRRSTTKGRCIYRLTKIPGQPPLYCRHLSCADIAAWSSVAKHLRHTIL